MIANSLEHAPKILKKIVLLLLFVFEVVAVTGQVHPVKKLQKDSTRFTLADTLKTKKKSQAYLDVPVYFPAKDSVVISMKDNKIKMYGEAKVSYEDKEITADYIEMSIDRKEVLARGRQDSLGKWIGQPVFKDGDDTYKTKELRYNFETRKAYVVDVRMKEEEGFLHSHLTKKDSFGILNIKDGKYTTCDAPHPHFYFAITKGKVIPNKLIVTGPLYLVVEDVPLPIGLPFGYLPKQQKRASGILMPRYGDDRARGFFLRDGGYYFAINDRMDLSLTGDIYSRGSWKASAQSRYKKRYKFNGSFGFDFATNVSGEKDIDQKKQRDFRVRWTHNQDPKAHPYRTFNASVNFSTSKYDRRNVINTYNNTADFMNNAYERLTNTKSSSISYSRKFPNKLFNFTAKLGHTQNSQTETVVLNVPSGTFTVGRFFPFRFGKSGAKPKWYEKIEMRYTSSFDNRIKAKQDELFKGNILNKMQNGFKQRIPISASFKPIKYMTLTPSLTYDGLLYFYHIEKHWDSQLDSLIVDRVNQLHYVQALSPNVNLSYSPRIYGFFTFKKGKVQAIRHVMSPSLSFSYRPDLGYDLSKFQDTTQVDTLGTRRGYNILDEGLYRLPSVAGRSGNISLNIGNNLEMKVKNPKDTTGTIQKVKLLESFSLNTSYDIFRDSLNLSPITLQARTTLLKKINLTFRSGFNAYAIDSVTTGNYTRYKTVNVFEVTRSGRPARLTNATFSLGFALPLKRSSQRSTTSTGRNQGENGTAAVDYSMPWNLSVNYNFQYTKPYMESKITQSLSFNGRVALTPKWSVSVASGYDFIGKQFTYTQIGVTRDLHCWEMRINVVPFGQLKSYMFSIAAKSSLLKDVKYSKNKSWSDTLY